MRRLGSRGETIVEVLIVTVILTSVMATAFAITTHSLNQNRGSQERSEASSYAQSQIEHLVAATNSGVITDPASTFQFFCLSDTETLIQVTDTSNVPAVCKSGRYSSYLTYDNTNNVYVEKVVWDNAIGSGQDNLSINYRTEFTQSSGIVVPPIVPGPLPPDPCTAIPAVPPPTGAMQACFYNDAIGGNGSYFTTKVLDRVQNPIGSGPNQNATNILDDNWGIGSPGGAVQVNDFSARYQGKFNFVAGNYTFFAGGDDGIKVYIDGNPIISHWIDQSYTQYAVSVPMSAGLKTVTMEFYERGGDARATLSWIPPTATVIEGESFPSPGAWIAPIAEAGASGGATMRFLSQGPVSGPVNTPAFNSIAVRARGDQYQGAPKMTVIIDGTTKIAGRDVPNTSYQIFNAPTGAFAAGPHTFQISFDNDACGILPDICGPATDRNLYVDSLTLIQN